MNGGARAADRRRRRLHGDEARATAAAATARQRDRRERRTIEDRARAAGGAISARTAAGTTLRAAREAVAARRAAGRDVAAAAARTAARGEDPGRRDDRRLEQQHPAGPAAAAATVRVEARATATTVHREDAVDGDARLRHQVDRAAGKTTETAGVLGPTTAATGATLAATERTGRQRHRSAGDAPGNWTGVRIALRARATGAVKAAAATAAGAADLVEALAGGARGAATGAAVGLERALDRDRPLHREREGPRADHVKRDAVRDRQRLQGHHPDHARAGADQLPVDLGRTDERAGAGVERPRRVGGQRWLEREVAGVELRRERHAYGRLTVEDRGIELRGIAGRRVDGLAAAAARAVDAGEAARALALARARRPCGGARLIATRDEHHDPASHRVIVTCGA